MFKKTWFRIILLLVVLAALGVYFRYLHARVLTALIRAPYPASNVVRGFSLNWDTLQRLAPGSGDWPITWADDDNQYTIWGNGGGFGGTDSDGRVYMGFGRIEGPKDNYQAFNVWGGKDAENPVQFGGKSYGLISVDGQIYMWRCGTSFGIADAMKFQELYVSTDHIQTWTSTGVKFNLESYPGADPGFACPTFLQFGKDNEGARDDYIYSYGWEVKNFDGSVQHPGQISLMRVLKSSISDIHAYEFFGGLDETNNPIWTQDIAQRKPVFEDPSGLSHPSIMYNPGLERYILTMEHSFNQKGDLAMYDAPEPWGPWTTVVYTQDFGWPGFGPNSYMWVISNKWLSEDGKDFVLIVTGAQDNDSWNSIEGHFDVAS